jgi:hypothetical protein
LASSFFASVVCEISSSIPIFKVYVKSIMSQQNSGPLPISTASKSESTTKESGTPADDDTFSLLDDLRGEDSTPAQERAKYIKDLFEGERTCQCCSKWVEQVPADLDDEVSEDEEEGAPLVVRRRRTWGGTKTWEIASIEIKSQALKDVLLKKILDSYNLRPKLKFLTLLAPFRDFYYNAEKFEKAIKEETDETVLNGLRILRHLVKPKYAADSKVAQELISNGLISYNLLWMLFSPGELIYTDRRGEGQLLRLTQVRVDGQVNLEYKYVHWDGLRFGYVDTSMIINYFIGTKKITELEAFPARCLPNLEAVKRQLLERGEKYRSLAGIHTKSYISRVDAQSKGSSNGALIERRIIVDNKTNPDRRELGITWDLWSDWSVSSALLQQQPFRTSNVAPNGNHIPLEATGKKGKKAFPYNNTFHDFGQIPMMGPGIPPPPPGALLGYSKKSRKPKPTNLGHLLGDDDAEEEQKSKFTVSMRVSIAADLNR